MQVINISEKFPDNRSRAVLIELLKVMHSFRENGVEAVLCGGWVPFLKELARRSETAHTMSLDIDVILRKSARDAAVVDLVRSLLEEQDYKKTEKEFQFSKNVDGNVVELELLADLARFREEDAVIAVCGKESSLNLCLVDGGEDLGTHVETITIVTAADGGERRTVITIPDPVGFLILKTRVTRYREKPKDPYDIYHYCRYSEEPLSIRDALKTSMSEPAVSKVVSDLKRMFTHADSKWVELAVEHMNVVGAEERARQAEFIVRAVLRVIEGLE